MIPRSRRAALLTILDAERHVKALALESYRAWLPRVRAAVLPTLTAAVEEPPPEPEAIALTEADWEAILAGVFLPGLAELLWARMTAELIEAGVTAGQLTVLLEAAARAATPGEGQEDRPGDDDRDGRQPRRSPRRPSTPPDQPRRRDDAPEDRDDEPAPRRDEDEPRPEPRDDDRPDDRAPEDPDVDDRDGDDRDDEERRRGDRDDDAPITPQMVAAIPSVQEWVEAYLATVNNRMVRTPDTAFRLIADELAEATRLGESIQQQRERVALILDAQNLETFGGRRAALVARTETCGALNAARLEAARVMAEVTGETLHKAWLATIDTRTRATHFAVDGQRVPIDGQFTLPGGVKMRWPGEPGAPAREVCNCVVGSTRVAWPGQSVLNATRRRHTGTFVDLTTARGHVLTITPNHPVLTPTGYVPAGELRPGDQVLATLAPTDTPDESDVPSRVEQLYGAMRDAGVEHRMVSSGVDFHGDATEDEEIHVVRADGELRLGLDSHLGRDVGEQLLARGRDAARPVSTRRSAVSARNTDGPGDRGPLGVAAAGVVGGGDQTPAIVGAHAREPDSIGFAGGAAGEPELVDAAVDRAAADAEVARHLEHAHATGMHPCELIKVNIYADSHDVYNLSTSDEWYSANGIAVHNCRCALMILADDEDLPDEGDRQTERGPGDSTVRNRAGTRQEEIDRRREEEGIVRARDDPAGIGQITSAAPPPERIRPMPTTFTAVLAHLGVATDDGRLLAEGMNLRFRDVPLPLRWQRQDVPEHMEAFTVGVIDTIELDGTRVIASGHLLDTVEAAEAALQIREGVTGPSVDLADVEWELRDQDGTLLTEEEQLTDETKIVFTMTSAVVTAATLVSIPAFGNTSITLDDVVTAAVTGSTDLPVAERDREWDGDAAAARVFDAFSDEDGNLDVEQVGQAFLWHDGEGADRGDWKLGFADLVDGELQIVPAGVAATAGGHGVDAADIPAEDADRIRARICDLYERVREEYEDWPECPFTPADEDDGGDEAATAALLAAVAAAPRFRPAADVFDNPGFTEPTPLHLTDDGRVQGHLATFGTCHVGISDRCVTPPHSATGYAHFHTSAVDTVDGTRLPVGRLTVGGGHADHSLGARAAAEHYDNTCTCWAYVRAGEDEHGIWVSGVLHPDATESQVREGLSAPLSGDWRTIGGQLELVAALSVNTPGFPVIRGRDDEHGHAAVLVASLAPRHRRPVVDTGILRAVAVEAVREYRLDEARRQKARALVAHRRRTEARALVAAVRNRRG